MELLIALYTESLPFRPDMLGWWMLWTLRIGLVAMPLLALAGYVHDRLAARARVRARLFQDLDTLGWLLGADAPQSACPSCNGMNTSCPVGCGRDPRTGELDGSTLDRAALAQHVRKVLG
jgi:hypothetical protein